MDTLPRTWFEQVRDTLSYVRHAVLRAWLHGGPVTW